VALTCPNCGNARNFQVKTLQMHVVQLDDGRVEVAEESRPAVFEVLCDECETAGFRAGRGHAAERSAAHDRRALTIHRPPHATFASVICADVKATEVLSFPILPPLQSNRTRGTPTRV
jgi:hypothetical protein